MFFVGGSLHYCHQSLFFLVKSVFLYTSERLLLVYSFCFAFCFLHLKIVLVIVSYDSFLLFVSLCSLE